MIKHKPSNSSAIIREEKGSSSNGLVGIAFGVFILLALAVLAVVFCCRRKLKKQAIHRLQFQLLAENQEGEEDCILVSYTTQSYESQASLEHFVSRLRDKYAINFAMDTWEASEIGRIGEQMWYSKTLTYAKKILIVISPQYLEVVNNWSDRMEECTENGEENASDENDEEKITPILKYINMMNVIEKRKNVIGVLQGVDHENLPRVLQDCTVFDYPTTDEEELVLCSAILDRDVSHLRTIRADSVRYGHHLIR